MTCILGGWQKGGAWDGSCSSVVMPTVHILLAPVFVSAQTCCNLPQHRDLSIVNKHCDCQHLCRPESFTLAQVWYICWSAISNVVAADMPGRQPNKLVASKLSSLLQDQVRQTLQLHLAEQQQHHLALIATACLTKFFYQYLLSDKACSSQSAAVGRNRNPQLVKLQHPMLASWAWESLAIYTDPS